MSRKAPFRRFESTTSYLILLGIFVGVLVAGCERAPETFEEAVSRTAAGKSGYTMTIEANVVRYGWHTTDAASYLLFVEPTRSAETIGKWLTKSKSQNAFTLKYSLRATFSDQYGQTAQNRVLEISIPSSELLKYNYENIFYLQLLDSATVDFIHPGAAAAVKELCEKHIKYVPLFCVSTALKIRRQ